MPSPSGDTPIRRTPRQSLLSQCCLDSATPLLSGRHVGRIRLELLGQWRRDKHLASGLGLPPDESVELVLINRQLTFV